VLGARLPLSIVTLQQRRLSVLFLAATAAISAPACTPPPPRSWQAGGTQLVLPDAQWILGEEVVQLTRNGDVIEGGDKILSIDTAGRVYDEDGEPVGVLERDGTYIGPDDEPLGMVGAVRASLPEEGYAWITVEPNGQVIRFDEDGNRYPFGAWFGCGRDPRSVQACTLVSHAIGIKIRKRQQSGGPSIGIGIGIGVPIR
jgi:hypothetical protein